MISSVIDKPPTYNMNNYRNAAKKALIHQKRRVRADMERIGLREEVEPTDPGSITRQVELDHLKELLLTNHLLLLEEEEAKRRNEKNPEDEKKAKDEKEEDIAKERVKGNNLFKKIHIY